MSVSSVASIWIAVYLYNMIIGLDNQFYDRFKRKEAMTKHSNNGENVLQLNT